MGCAISKPDSDVIRQCKERRKMIREAVNSRQEFAMAHAAYIQTLRNVGRALRRFSEGEVTITSPPSSLPPSSPVLPRLTGVSSSSSPPSAFVVVDAASAAVSAATDEANVVIPLSPPASATVAVSLPSLSASPPSSPHAPPSLTHSPSPSPSPSPAPPPHSDASAMAKPSTPSAGSPALPISISPRFSSAATSPVPPLFAQASSPASDTMVPLYSVNGMGSPDRASDFSPPFYSPRRDDFEDYNYVPYSPSPNALQTPPPMPSPNRNSSSWFFYDIFEAPPIPYNLLQNRRRIQGSGGDDDADYDVNENDDSYVNVKDFDQIRKEEGIPDLEEDELREDEQNHGLENGKDVADEETAYSEVAVEDRKVELANEKAAESAEDVTPAKETNGHVEQIPAVPSPPSSPKEQEVIPQLEREESSALAFVTDENGRDLTGAVRHIHNHFSRAYTSGKDVSNMLETQLVLHSLTGLDSKEPAKFFNAITTHWSRKATMAMKDNHEDSDAAEAGMFGSHAATLERIYAWEKKLYEEVKAGEVIQMSFDRKRNKLQNLDAKGSDKEVVEKTRADLTKLENQLEVALKAIQLASERIQMMTNEELYLQLAELLGGLMSMWKVMWECHKAQKAIASEMQTIDNSVAGNEASEAHIKATMDLKHELENWESQFKRWICSQMDYIEKLYQWLSKCHMMGADDHYDQNDKPEVFHFLENWCAALKGLKSQDQVVVQAIHGFAAVVRSLELEQQGELFVKKNAEKSARDLDYHSRSLERMEKKYLGYDGGSNASSNVQSKRADIDIQRTLVENEQRKHSEIMQDRREKTLSSFREHLPSIFDAMASFAKDALKAYEAVARPKGMPIRENGEMHVTAES